MRRLLLAAALLALPGCYASDEPVSPFSTDVSIRAGTSFGHCIGYCETELAIGPSEIVLTRTSRQPQEYPTRTERLPISGTEYEGLLDALDAEVFLGMEEVLGCPDCADGGAEWIEVERSGGDAKRVTFEYGATIEPIAPLVERIRALRARFPEG